MRIALSRHGATTLATKPSPPRMRQAVRPRLGRYAESVGYRLMPRRDGYLQYPIAPPWCGVDRQRFRGRSTVAEFNCRRATERSDGFLVNLMISIRYE